MRYIKKYEGFTARNNNNWLSKLYHQDIPADIVETIEYRLMPITDILDKNGKTYDIDVEYTPPSQIFSGEWSNHYIEININKSNYSEFEIMDVVPSVIELISELKEYKYIFKEFYLESPAKLKYTCDIDNPKVIQIEKLFKNLQNEVLGDAAASPANRNKLKYGYTSRISLTFEKKYKNKYRKTPIEGEMNESFMEPKNNWEFYKKHGDVPGITHDVLSELTDMSIRSSTKALLYPDGNSVFQVMIGNPGWSREFTFKDIKPTILELISQLGGNGLKFYRYEAYGFKNKGWNRGVSNIYNDHITRFPLNAFTIEFIEA